MPVFIQGNQIDGIVQGFTVLIIFLFVLLLTMWVTKWIAGYQKQQFKQKNLEVIETIRISQTKYIQIIRVGHTYMAIGIGKDTISMLGKIDKEELLFVENEDVPTESFQEILKRIRNKKKPEEEMDKENDKELKR